MDPLDIIANFFARRTFGDAGGAILDVHHAELIGPPEQLRATVDRIADFVGMPLDRDAMVKRLDVTKL